MVRRAGGRHHHSSWRSATVRAILVPALGPLLVTRSPFSSFVLSSMPRSPRPASQEGFLVWLLRRIPFPLSSTTTVSSSRLNSSPTRTLVASAWRSTLRSASCTTLKMRSSSRSDSRRRGPATAGRPTGRFEPSARTQPADGIDQAEVIQQRRAQIFAVPANAADGLGQNRLHPEQAVARPFRGAVWAHRVDLGLGNRQGLQDIVVELAREALSFGLLGFGRQLDVRLQVLLGLGQLRQCLACTRVVEDVVESDAQLVRNCLEYVALVTEDDFVRLRNADGPDRSLP